ncbi:MAG: hypothetical protein A2351_07730 [Omnitrophica bacterium RIFOXYB12_FULL_50_7]|nr:MAG: hypothetical protein A2351_07730 [Omnitrophica bacterium RIFOXYB12_FULL_50_7]
MRIGTEASLSWLKSDLKPLEKMNYPEPYTKRLMKKEKISNGDLLYHPIHGLCRVERVTPPSLYDRGGPSYSLVPKIATRMKSRFVISAADLEVSGFHGLVTPKEANKILHYLKAGNGKGHPGTDSSSNPQDQTWDLARALQTFAYDKFEAKDQRKRQALERSAKGLVGELSCVFKITLKKTADRVLKNLGHASRINPSVLSALALAGED